LIFPRIEGLPYHPYRPALYTADELMEGYQRGVENSFSLHTRDARIYAHYDGHRRRAGPVAILEALAQRLHDHAIDDALGDLLHIEPAPRIVAVMGGHAMARSASVFARVISLGRQLARKGYCVSTGGGPGAMEAANLGAYLAQHPIGAVEQAAAILAPAPTYKHPDWFDTAYAVRDRWPGGDGGLAIPTWFYGHEPSNLFSRSIAKYFSNSLREDGLLAIASHGVVFTPGSAGTVQEIFMDAAQNHYGTFKVVSPMVFFGTEHWTERLPVMSLLRNLAGSRQYAARILLTDDIDEIAPFIEAHPPVPYAG